MLLQLRAHGLAGQQLLDQARGRGVMRAFGRLARPGGTAPERLAAGALAGRPPRASSRYWILQASLYLGLIALYRPSLKYAPIRLDDYRELAYVSERSASQLWGVDAFGHFRPLKNLLFWALGQTLDSVELWRFGVLCALVACVCLVQRVSERVLESRDKGLFAAALWALNPALATVVCWLSTLNVLLCVLGVGAYFLLGTRCLRQSTSAITPALAAAWLVLMFSCLSYALALVAPLALLAYDRQLQSAPRWRLRHPMILGSLACSAAYLALALHAGIDTSGYRTHEPASVLALNGPRYFALNLSLWLWPRQRFGVMLSDAPSQHVLSAVACGLGLFAAAFALWRIRRRLPKLTFGLTWCALFLAPVCDLVPIGNAPLAVHYLALPAIGLSIAASDAAALVTARLPRRWLRISLGTAVAAAVGFSWVTETARVIDAWSSDQALFAATIDNYPKAVEPRVNLAAAFMRAGRDRDAQTALDAAERLAPNDPLVLRNRLSLLLRMKQPHAALELLDRHAELARDADLLFGRGEALEALGRYAAAERAFEQAFKATDRTANAQQRFAVGFRWLLSLLRAGDETQAHQVLQALSREFPQREELEAARKVLGDPGH